MKKWYYTELLKNEANTFKQFLHLMDVYFETSEFYKVMTHYPEQQTAIFIYFSIEIDVMTNQLDVINFVLRELFYASPLELENLTKI